MILLGLLLAIPSAGQGASLPKPPLPVVQPGQALSPLRTSVPFDRGVPRRLAAIIEADVNRSMKVRRDLAWSIVADAWRPVETSGGAIPLWMTWYEEEDVRQLYADVVSRARRATSPTQLPNLVASTLASRATKDLRASLNSRRLGKVLRQFTIKGAPGLGPNRKPQTGSIYYNPAFVRHLLDNAARIARTDPAAYPNVEDGQKREKPMDLGAVPLSLRPADSGNHFALAMDREMPEEAIMVKVAWTPVITQGVEGQAGYGESVQAHRFDITSNMGPRLTRGPVGEWIEYPLSLHVGGVPSEQLVGFQVADEKGKKWYLLGMHLASKRLRTWLWISLFSHGWPWNADRPASVSFVPTGWPVNVLRQYGMCAVSDFVEGDPAPWSHYVGRGSTQQAQFDHRTFVDALRAVSQAMGGAQWGSNPYIETTMARGNCIGCHQASSEGFLSHTVSRLKTFNVTDFSFSFATNRANFRSVMGLP